ncbi:MAG: MmcB family DNA repair protein, partial [Proteobacteria bacterium]|nr:MmcB family DNA repair protein [Pseudomonadota bacterium]
RLDNGRRADVFGLNTKGDIAIVEIKLSVANFRSDEKWPEYLPHCNRFYFAVAEAFPQELIPQSTGLIIADRFGGAVIRQANPQPMTTSLRNKEIRRFALYAANRLRRVQDPEMG